MERQLPRERAGLHQQHPAARRRHASGGLPRRADAAGDRLWRILRPDQEGKGGADRRRLPRGADGGAVGQGSRSEILLADQGQAGFLGSAAGGRRPRQRGARHLARGTSGRRQGGHREGDPGGGGARSGAQGARHHAQELARRHLAARQARRLPGARSGEVRNLHRRGRFGRRLGQGRALAPEPGDPAAARQDPERRARALRPHARLPR